jgi:2'-5' RNA ligase
MQAASDSERSPSAPGEKVDGEDRLITSYADDIRHWEEWQKAYRFGVILVYPPDPPASAVNSLRDIHDPRGQSFCSAHISLTVPLSRPMEDYHLDELIRITSEIEPVPVRYGPLSNYLPVPGVVLAIEPKDRFKSLVEKLESASVFENAAPRPHPFSPHLTIAEFISGERTLELMDELQGAVPEGEFLCDNVSYAVPDENLSFTERANLKLFG